MSEKEFQFSRLATYVEYGIVTAENEEEARQKIINGEEDDIYDTSLENEDNDTIKEWEVK